MTSERYKTHRGNILQRLGVAKATPELAGTPEHPVWMHPIEFSQVLAVLKSLKPKRMLEWGSGGSSRAWLKAMPELEMLWSVEHHEAWANTVRESITDPRFHLSWEPAQGEPEPEHIPGNKETGARHWAWCMKHENDPKDMLSYVENPVEAGVVFDVALVDGRARVHCLRKAYELVRPGGMIILHDAQREAYHPTAHELGDPLFLEPWVQGQVCLIRREA